MPGRTGKASDGRPRSVAASVSFCPVQASRLPEQIVNQISDLIVGGRLSPGDRLPPERELARAFGVGRSSVREAFRALEAASILEIRPGNGTFLAAGWIFRLLLPSGAIRDSLEQRSVLEARLVFEPAVAALAALRSTPEDIVRLREMVGSGHRDERRASCASFLIVLTETARNPFLQVIVRHLGALMERTPQPPNRSSPLAPLLAQHRKVLRAIEAHDPAASRRHMRAHLNYVWEPLPLGD